MVFLHSKAVVKGEVSSPRETDIVDTRRVCAAFLAAAVFPPRRFVVLVIDLQESLGPCDLLRKQFAIATE